MGDDSGLLRNYLIKLEEIIQHNMNGLSVSLRQAVVNLATNFENSFETMLREYAQNRLKPFIQLSKELAEHFDNLPPYMKDAFLKLGNRGWYVGIWDMSIPLIMKLHAMIKRGDILSADEVCAEYFNEKVDSIEKLAAGKFPDRVEILRAAFKAHRRGEYVLSVPVFLAQTDGICYAVTKKNLFMSKDGKPQTANYVEQFANDAFWSAVLQPLAQPLPINYTWKDRRPDFTELNRHMILHGESLDYGTKTNSLKAISLLNYVVQVLNAPSLELGQQQT